MTRGHAYALERHDRMGMTDVVGVRRRPHHPYARRVDLDDEQRLPTGVLPRRQYRLEEDVRRLFERRDMPLLPVEHVVVAVAPGGRLDRGDVGPGALLGDRVALRHLAAD